MRAYSDDVNRRLLARWLPPHATRLLKTDLFDEAVSEGLYPTLRGVAEIVVGVDLSHKSVAAARGRYPELEAHVGDIRALPFPDASFDAVVSNSTLDHFASFDDVVTGVNELARVLAPGGHLVITLDNAWNPLVALRNALPYRSLNRLGLVPYFVGVTCGPARLRATLEQAGFTVTEMSAVMHFPRVVARVLGLGRCGRRRLATRRALQLFESFSRLPTRYLTGQFVAAKAYRPGAAVPAPAERPSAYIAPPRVPM